MSEIKLLLHTCCAPCLIGTLSRLPKTYEPIIYFYNPNIHPKEEYIRRRDEAKKFCGDKGLAFIEGEYDVEKWFEAIKNVKNYATEPEGGKRCEECFKMRLERTAIKAVSMKIKFFTTTLTLGENKNAQVINRLGKSIGEKYNLFFLQADFKKRNGYNKSVEESKKLGIYRQTYCGCVYSMRTNEWADIEKSYENEKLK